ncbi:DNA replication/repair protein RecF [Fulvimarina sp. 2208YS6-2-32]|uniref:DNA replication and repair protein RecF n=1 Tax=Fulvimarina uroteuthidis TaxID=3098149 RepID=A0ABU5I3E9_9HYPH|nr:DNA replication/repair protein RecF [Fulvimarina sp. 2208YS6-2-32]MDY8109647.1 DNA replication/repair protein RecF [Fulvimarina sp. 2208YS6-2-32]
MADDRADASSGVESLKLFDFRNYATLSLEFDKRFVVFAGPNGAGKTNLLEALSLLSPGRGLRRATYADMVRKGGENAFSIRAGIVADGDETIVATSVRLDGEGSSTRQVKIGETQVRSSEELLDLARIVWLTPAMDGLFTGPAGDRRRFLDRMVLSVDPAHGKRATDFERAMRSRNRLLSDNRLDDRWLSGIEMQMAELGVAMAFARAEMVANLTHAIAMADPSAPFPKAGLFLMPGLDEADFGKPAVEIEDLYRDRLSRERRRDMAAGRTLEGPHRADLSVLHLAKDMPAGLSSTGEQKALLVGLVIAHARLTSTLSGMAPILLLDEIAAHLDAGRRASLFDLVGELGGQTFMTGTDRDLFEALGDRAQMMTIAEGAAERA